MREKGWVHCAKCRRKTKTFQASSRDNIDHFFVGEIERFSDDDKKYDRKLFRFPKGKEGRTILFFPEVKINEGGVAEQ